MSTASDHNLSAIEHTAKYQTPRRTAVWVTLGLFAVLLAVYAVSPVITSYDSRWSMHTAMSLAQGKGGDLSDYRKSMEASKFYAIEYPDGRPRTHFPIGTSLLAAPAVVIAAWVSPSFMQQLQEGGGDRVEKLIASIIGALAGVFFFWLIWGQFGSLWIAGASTFIFAFATSMWSSATRALWQHGPLVLMLLIAMLLLQRARHRPALIQYVSLPLAFSFLIRPTAMVAILVISAYVALYHRRWLLRYLCWSALIAVPWLAHNYSVYGNLFPPYYFANQGNIWFSFPESLLGTLISPSRGLLIYSPVLILSVSGFVLALRDRAQRPLYLVYGLIAILLFIVIARAPMWWAGHSYGPRFTTDVVPFLAFFSAFSIAYFAALRPRARIAGLGVTAVLAIVSAAIHAQGAIRANTMQWNVLPNNIDDNPARLWDWKDPQFLRGGYRPPKLSARHPNDGLRQSRQFVCHDGERRGKIDRVAERADEHALVDKPRA